MHQDVLLGMGPPKATPLGSDPSCFVHTYANSTTKLHFVANEGKAGKHVTLSGGKFYCPAGVRLLLSSSAAASASSAVADAPTLLFNSSAVGGNTKPPFTVKTATTSALSWSTWVEGTPHRCD
jgi:hypothetical protein